MKKKNSYRIECEHCKGRELSLREIFEAISAHDPVPGPNPTGRYFPIELPVSESPYAHQNMYWDNPYRRAEVTLSGLGATAACIGSREESVSSAARKWARKSMNDQLDILWNAFLEIAYTTGNKVSWGEVKENDFRKEKKNPPKNCVGNAA